MRLRKSGAMLSFNFYTVSEMTMRAGRLRVRDCCRVERWIGVALIAMGAAVVPSLQAIADTYLLPRDGSSVVGEVRTLRARAEDTFPDIARRYNVGFNDLVLANPDVDPWVPKEGTEVVVPTFFVLPAAPRDGLVLNLPEMRLYYFPKPKRGEPPVVVTYPASIGRMEWKTPLGKTKIIKKQSNPAWYPPQSVRAEHAADGDVLPAVVPPGPDNPLGAFALRLGIPGYLIHGTNRPYGVGMRVTHGCIRLYPEDIRSLFGKVNVGTPVYLVNQPFKAGWRNNVLYFEAHPPLDEDAIQLANNRTPAVKAVIEASTDGQLGAVDWRKLHELVKAASGVPIPVTVATSVTGGPSETPVIPVEVIQSEPQSQLVTEQISP